MNGDDKKDEPKENEEKTEVDRETDKESKLPEIKKSTCPICNKEFSSIWVLKAHSEEIHKDVVPQDFIEKYVEELKSNKDKDNESDSTNSSSKESPEKDGDAGAGKGCSPPPNDSTCSGHVRYRKYPRRRYASGM